MDNKEVYSVFLDTRNKGQDTLSFDKLKIAVEKSLKKITKQNLENYFQNAYGTRPNIVKNKST